MGSCMSANKGESNGNKVIPGENGSSSNKAGNLHLNISLNRKCQ